MPCVIECLNDDLWPYDTDYRLQLLAHARSDIEPQVHHHIVRCMYNM
jgi:hypothetical protein